MIATLVTIPAMIIMIAAIVLLRRRLAAARLEIEKRDHRISTTAHELRGPLQPLLLSVERLKREDQLSDKGREALLIMEKNLEAESRLIEDLWETTRGGRPPVLRTEPVDVNAVVREITDAAMASAGEERVALTCHLDPASPWVLADPVRLRQIVRNLVDNAVKFTPPGGRVIVRTDRGAGASATLSIEDEGPGIAQAMQERIFEPYVQLPGAEARGGLGLGLHLARKLTLAQGGSLTLRSDGPGRGSTFLVSLPRAPRERAASAPSSNGTRVRVLLAEDHEDSARMIDDLLVARGFDVTTVGSVAGGVAAGERARFDVLVSDLELPDGSGLDLMRRLRARSSDVRGVALSGRRSEADEAASRSSGFGAHLLKPIDFEALLAAIAGVLEEPLNAPRTGPAEAGSR